MAVQLFSPYAIRTALNTEEPNQAKTKLYKHPQYYFSRGVAM